MITRRNMIKGISASILLAGLPARASARAPHVETGPAFGSAWRLVLASRQDAQLARKAIKAVVERIDKRMSPFRGDSELARFNAAKQPSRGVPISEETSHVISSALEIARASDGAFDPTCAPWVRRFGFGPTRISAHRPAGIYQDIEVVDHLLKSTTPEISLDLCASAKGHALDQMAKELEGLDFLLELGGEITARGSHPSGRPWQIGIERPGSVALQRIIAAGNGVVATSSNGREGYQYSGQSYGHIIDPRTARPVVNDVASVSVMAQTGLWADSLATAALVLGPDKAAPLLKSYQARALFLMRNGQNIEELDLFGFTEGQV